MAVQGLDSIWKQDSYSQLININLENLLYDIE